MPSSETLPSISIVIPTFNSSRTLLQCLESTFNQDYPSDKIERIIVDGGSRDETMRIVSMFKVDLVLKNPLRTGEAGKALGVAAARNDIILLQDSDNVLDGSGWLQLMVSPFADDSIVGAEPLSYTYRHSDSFITRYCALVGMNDPVCLYIGNYDRYSLVTRQWTGLRVEATETQNFLNIRLTEGNVPTIGANGFMIRRSCLQSVPVGSFLFDVDLVQELVADGLGQFAKVKIGIVHLFADDISTYGKKTFRRIRDYYFYSGNRMRQYRWQSLAKRRIPFFVFSTVFVFPIARDEPPRDPGRVRESLRRLIVHRGLPPLHKAVLRRREVAGEAGHQAAHAHRPVSQGVPAP